jgi:hypothetical protein
MAELKEMDVQVRNGVNWIRDFPNASFFGHSNEPYFLVFGGDLRISQW